MSTATTLELETVTLEREGHVLVMGLNRPEKRNAFTRQMLSDLSRAYALLESDDELRAGVLFGNGEHFTSGLDMVDVAGSLASGESPYPEDGRDPWRLDGWWTKPIVAAAQGWVLTLGIELLLATDLGSSRPTPVLRRSRCDEGSIPSVARPSGSRARQVGATRCDGC